MLIRVQSYVYNFVIKTVDVHRPVTATLNFQLCKAEIGVKVRTYVHIYVRKSVTATTHFQLCKAEIGAKVHIYVHIYVHKPVTATTNFQMWKLN